MSWYKEELDKEIIRSRITAGYVNDLDFLYRRVIRKMLRTGEVDETIFSDIQRLRSVIGLKDVTPLREEQ
jgi:hypothetical protein